MTLGIEIEKMVVLSTAHLPSNDVYRLENMAKKRIVDEGDVIVYQADHWFQVYLPDCDTSKMSKEFIDIVVWAKKHEEDFTWLKFDAAGPVMEQFPHFDW